MSLIVWILIIGLLEYLTNRSLGAILAPVFVWIINWLRSIGNRL